MAAQDRHGSQRGDGPMAEIAAAAGGVLWTGAVLGWWLTRPEGQGPGLLMVMLLLLAPLALIGMLITTLRSLRELRAETAHLHEALAAARTPPKTTARPVATRAEPQLAEEPEPEEPAATSDLTLEDYLRALNFPDSPEDEAAIDALQRVLADPEAARLIRSAQDVLTLLAQDGVFVDDLTPEPPRPDLWRRFAAGERGASTAGVGAVRDRAALSAATARMREDQIFQDAAHHFLRTFERSLPAFGEYATDGELVELAETRTARAFMLLARASGVFE